jgi:cytoskeletal protein CcmA (bactofilin family)
MALWNEKGSTAPAPASPSAPPPGTVTDLYAKTEKPAEAPPAPAPAVRAKERVVGSESVIAAELTVEGKIAGAGNVRMAGRFKGDVQVDGNFRIDQGARLEGQVRASTVVVGGELQGNIDAAKHVDVLESGVIVGDVKAGSITVAAGSRMRGHVEFGWDDEKSGRAFDIKGGRTG